MIVSKTPVRMSFVGGGSDLPAFYHQHQGAVLSTSINRYIYITVNKKFDPGVRLAYSINEDVSDASELKHPIVPHALKLLNINTGIEITTIADIPSKGSGLGSSSTFTVGLLNALSAYTGTGRDKQWLAENSCHVEIGLCKEPIGKQDQYAAAYGGLNIFEFNSDKTVNVIPVHMPLDYYETLEENILLFYTGVVRSASKILLKQGQSILADPKKVATMKEMVSQVYLTKEILETGDLNQFGEILHNGWVMKRSLSSDISSSIFDDMYEAARSAGALGGKILGAGAGGFLMLYAEKNKHKNIKATLSKLQYTPFKFDQLGSQIILNN